MGDKDGAIGGEGRGPEIGMRVMKEGVLRVGVGMG